MTADKGKTTLLSFWRSLPALLAGLLFGLVATLVFRASYYEMLQIESEMGARNAFLFAPVLLVILVVIALPFELVLRLMSKPRNYREAAAIGVSHAMIASFWAFPMDWWIGFALNPITIRVVDLCWVKWRARQADNEPSAVAADIDR